MFGRKKDRNFAEVEHDSFFAAPTEDDDLDNLVFGQSQARPPSSVPRTEPNVKVKMVNQSQSQQPTRAELVAKSKQQVEEEKKKQYDDSFYHLDSDDEQVTKTVERINRHDQKQASQAPTPTVSKKTTADTKESSTAPKYSRTVPASNGGGSGASSNTNSRSHTPTQQVPTTTLPQKIGKSPATSRANTPPVKKVPKEGDPLYLLTRAQMEEIEDEFGYLVFIQLLDMGFPEQVCRLALKKCNGNINAATEMCLQYNEDVFRAMLKKEGDDVKASVSKKQETNSESDQRSKQPGLFNKIFKTKSKDKMDSNPSSKATSAKTPTSKTSSKAPQQQPAAQSQQSSSSVLTPPRTAYYVDEHMAFSDPLDEFLIDALEDEEEEEEEMPVPPPTQANRRPASVPTSAPLKPEVKIESKEDSRVRFVATGQIVQAGTAPDSKNNSEKTKGKDVIDPSTKQVAAAFGQLKCESDDSLGDDCEVQALSLYSFDENARTKGHPMNNPSDFRGYKDADDDEDYGEILSTNSKSFKLSIEEMQHGVRARIINGANQEKFLEVHRLQSVDEIEDTVTVVGDDDKNLGLSNDATSSKRVVSISSTIDLEEIERQVNEITSLISASSSIRLDDPSTKTVAYDSHDIVVGESSLRFDSDLPYHATIDATTSTDASDIRNLPAVVSITHRSLATETKDESVATDLQPLRTSSGKDLSEAEADMLETIQRGRSPRGSKAVSIRLVQILSDFIDHESADNDDETEDDEDTANIVTAVSDDEEETTSTVGNTVSESIMITSDPGTPQISSDTTTEANSCVVSPSTVPSSPATTHLSVTQSNAVHARAVHHHIQHDVPSDYVWHFHKRQRLPYQVTRVQVPSDRIVNSNAEAGTMIWKYRGTITLKQPYLSKSDVSPQGTQPDVVVLGLCENRDVCTDLCEAVAPPVWMSKQDQQGSCYLCSIPFGMFHAGHHCRNCGLLVCNNCSDKIWPSGMLPSTFHNHEKMVRACHSCHYIMELFIQALRMGDYDEALLIYNTGNINLHSPYLVYEDAAYPIHVAASGGNVKLMRWLVDEKKCSLVDKKTTLPLTTSTGLTALAVAAFQGHVEIMKYLIHEKNCSITEINDVHILQRVLVVLLESPESIPIANPNNSKAQNKVYFDHLLFPSLFNPSATQHSTTSLTTRRQPDLSHLQHVVPTATAQEASVITSRLEQAHVNTNVLKVHTAPIALNGITGAPLMAKAYNKALCSQAVFAVNEIIEHQRHAFVYVQPESAR